MRSLFYLIVVFLACMSMVGCQMPSMSAVEYETGQRSERFEATIQKQVSFDYLLYLPGRYSEEESWPLILSLHGSSMRGRNVARLIREGVPNMLEMFPGFRFIVVSPQLPPNEMWENDSLMALLDEVISKYNVDERRIYLTGYDIGGFAVWNLAAEHPDRFAAIIPMAASGNVKKMCALRGVPVWALHGEKDPLIPVKEAQAGIEALIRCGGTARFTIMPDLGHNVWDICYPNVELYLWLLEYQRKMPTEEKSRFGWRSSKANDDEDRLFFPAAEARTRMMEY